MLDTLTIRLLQHKLVPSLVTHYNAGTLTDFCKKTIKTFKAVKLSKIIDQWEGKLALVGISKLVNQYTMRWPRGHISLKFAGGYYHGYISSMITYGAFNAINKETLKAAKEIWNKEHPEHKHEFQMLADMILAFRSDWLHKIFEISTDITQ